MANGDLFKRDARWLCVKLTIAAVLNFVFRASRNINIPATGPSVSFRANNRANFIRDARNLTPRSIFNQLISGRFTKPGERS